MRHVKSPAAFALKAVFFTQMALASSVGQAFFSDDEARRAILDLRSKVEVLNQKQQEISSQLGSLVSQGQSTQIRLDELTPRISDTETKVEGSGKGQLQLLNETEKLRAEIAALRGQIEQTLQQIRVSQQAQKDFYTDLDRRLKSLEPVSVSADGLSLRVSPQEADQFRSLQETFRGNDTNAILTAALRFERQFPNSALLPSVILIRGTALYVAKNYQGSIAARQEFLKRFPNHPGSLQAVMNLAASQAESGDVAAARKTLQAVIANNPDAAIVAEAKLRLDTLPAQ